MIVIKSIIVLICVTSILACQPVEQKPSQPSQAYYFSCLSSQSACLIETELGAFSVEFSGATIEGMLKTELPFQVQVRFIPDDKRYQLTGIESYLEGKAMFMGKVPVFFDGNTTKNTVQAETLLASCHEEVMTWRLWLTIEVSQADEVRQQHVFVDFDSKRL